MGKAESRLAANKFEGLTKRERRELIRRNREVYKTYVEGCPEGRTERTPRRPSVCSDVTVTRSDGSVEVRPAYSGDELRRIAPERPPIPEWMKQRILRRDRGACRYCGKTDGPFHLDHVVPVAHGGRTSLRNPVTACETCNLRKGVSRWTPRPIGPRRKG